MTEACAPYIAQRAVTVTEALDELQLAADELGRIRRLQAAKGSATLSRQDGAEVLAMRRHRREAAAAVQHEDDDGIDYHVREGYECMRRVAAAIRAIDPDNAALERLDLEVSYE